MVYYPQRIFTERFGDIMANIRSFLKEKKKREQKQAGYKEKIIRHKLTSVYRILLAVAGVAALVVLIVVQYRRHVYTDYDIVSTVARESAGGTTDVRLGNAILTYSRDGAHCTDAKGNITWNQTYQIQDVRLAVSRDIAAIGDYNGRSIYVQNTQQQLGVITTTMPIQAVAVSACGNVTAVLSDTDVVWINTYNPSGDRLYHGTASMDDSGYPTAISLSPSGELLCVAYLYLDADVLKTNLAFYNLKEVGENYNDFLVKSDSFTDLVPYMQFMNDSTLFAVGDGCLRIYTGNHQPVLAAGYILDEEVKSVFYSEEYVGLMFRSENSEYLYRMDVYNTAAKKVNSFYYNIEYTDLFFDKDNIVIYNETECVITTMDKIEKFNGSFSKPVRLMLPGNGAYRYILVTDTSIDTIQLK